MVLHGILHQRGRQQDIHQFHVRVNRPSLDVRMRVGVLVSVVLGTDRGRLGNDVKHVVTQPGQTGQ
jgi:hypothetical protein